MYFVMIETKESYRKSLDKINREQSFIFKMNIAPI